MNPFVHITQIDKSNDIRSYAERRLEQFLSENPDITQHYCHIGRCEPNNSTYCCKIAVQLQDGSIIDSHLHKFYLKQVFDQTLRRLARKKELLKKPSSEKVA